MLSGKTVPLRLFTGILTNVEFMIGFGIFPLFCKRVGLSVLCFFSPLLLVTICYTTTLKSTGKTRIGNHVKRNNISYNVNVAFYCNLHNADLSPRELNVSFTMLIIKAIYLHFLFDANTVEG